MTSYFIDYIYGTRDKQQQNKDENVHRFAKIERENRYTPLREVKRAN